MNFGMRVLPCEAQPGVELFVNAPQFSAKDFSHVFSHDDKYDIPGDEAFFTSKMSKFEPFTCFHCIASSAQLKLCCSIAQEFPYYLPKHSVSRKFTNLQATFLQSVQN